MRVALLVPFLLSVPRLWAQGPPYQTDDPVPVDLHHYEFYIFGSMDGTTAEIDATGPAIEFNWAMRASTAIDVVVHGDADAAKSALEIVPGVATVAPTGAGDVVRLRVR